MVRGSGSIATLLFTIRPVDINMVKENLMMFDYRLFFPNSTLDERPRTERRPILGHDERRVYRVTERRAGRQTTRR